MSPPTSACFGGRWMYLQLVLRCVYREQPSLLQLMLEYTMHQHAHSGAYCAPNASADTVSDSLSDYCTQCISDLAW